MEAMTSMNISLPESMKEFIDEQVQKEGYGTASEYVRDLIRLEQRRQAEERLYELLRAGLDSPRTEVTDEFWAQIRQEVEERFAKRAKQ